MNWQTTVMAAQRQLIADQTEVLRRTLSATEGALRETRRAADAATTQASVAEATLRDLERPYVFVERLDFVDNEANAEAPQVLHVTLTNYGRTPAIMCEVRSLITVQTLDFPEGGSAALLSHLVPTTRVIGADKSVGGLKVSPEDLDAFWSPRIRAGDARLDITLHVRYGNVFGPEVREDVFNLSYDYALREFLRMEDIPEHAARHDEEEYRQRESTRRILDPSYWEEERGGRGRPETGLMPAQSRRRVLARRAPSRRILTRLLSPSPVPRPRRQHAPAAPGHGATSGDRPAREAGPGQAPRGGSCYRIPQTSRLSLSGKRGTRGGNNGP